ncbi:MAG: patatin-like phospholipase family protein [Candidatus Acetothermia bacterium]|jgi:NTE family protein|nr:patatin-like phospholipase family protein [Candidatus Acetothermia bacterium]MDH7504541.1 patatin-like phospholipase family protein [Candidatus Acetothermia bacterium]
MTRPRIGLALGGGGARGYAHIGVLRVLQREGIPVDIVVGTSMGAIIGGAYAVGLEMSKLEQILARLDLNKLLDIPASAVGSVAGRIATELFTRTDWRRVEHEGTRKLCQFFSVFTKGLRFEDLKLKFAVVAADIDTGEEVVIEEGPLHRAIAASATFPGIHYPIKYGDRFLVDGGVVNKLPADVALRLGAEIVIAVEVSAPLAREVQTSIEVLSQAEMITGRELVRVKLEAVRRQLGERLILLRPKLDKISMLSLDEVSAAAREGEREALRHLEKIKALLAQPLS